MTSPCCTQNATRRPVLVSSIKLGLLVAASTSFTGSSHELVGSSKVLTTRWSVRVVYST